MPSKMEDKRARAIGRQEARAQRTPQEQLKRLDDLLGEGKGAAKERARLAKPVKVSPTSEVAAKTKAAWETVPQPHGTGAATPPELSAKVERFSKAHVDGKAVVFAGLGAGGGGMAILAYAPNPKKVNLPTEFECMEVLVVKGSRPKPAAG
jgi:hypothetical protein